MTLRDATNRLVLLRQDFASESHAVIRHETQYSFHVFGSDKDAEDAPHARVKVFQNVNGEDYGILAYFLRGSDAESMHLPVGFADEKLESDFKLRVQDFLRQPQ